MLKQIQLPKKVTLESGEEPVFITRQHWYVFRDSLLLTFFIPFVLLSGVFFLEHTLWPSWLKDNLGQILLIFAGGFFIFGLFLFLWRLYLWLKTYYIVTNHRLILITQYSFFHHDDRETPLNMIQDVKAEVNGFQPSLYGYGDVRIQVSSKDASLIFKKVGKPHRVQKIIMREAHLS